jgi:hypothetical protein
VSDRHVYQLHLVHSQYLTARAALEFAASQSEAVLIESDFWEGRSFRQVRDTIKGLSDTYLVRLFCEFETVLRDHWQSVNRNPQEPSVNYLIDHSLGAAARFTAMRARLHEVQRTRNDIVHHRASDGRQISYDEARKHLSRYHQELPERRG